MPLAMWVVYDKTTSDHPDEYVARRFEGEEPQRGEFDFMAASDLETLQSALSPGRVWMDRHPDDDPVILGVWL